MNPPPSPKLSRISGKNLANNPRASLETWLRFSHIIEEAYAKRPLEHTFKPTILAPSTVVSQIRDSLRGAIAFGYPTTIPADELSAFFSAVTITTDGTTVRIGPRPKPGDIREESTPAVPSGFAFTTLAPDELDAFELLLSTGRIQGPVKIKQVLHDLSAARPNVERVFSADGSLILL